MAAATTVRDVLNRYASARAVYQRFIGECYCHPQVARNAVALLVCFDRGTNQLISQVPSMSTPALGQLLHEASSLIRCLHISDPLVGPPTPLLSTLCRDNRMDDCLYFPVNKDLILRSVTDLLDGVCRLIFDDHLCHLLRRHQIGLVGRHPELEAYYTGVVTVPEDYRSMLVTFALGQAVEREEIFEYFSKTWGDDCVVRLLMDATNGGAQPMYGRIIFKSKAFVSLLLNGNEYAQIFIQGRGIWLCEYIPGNN